MKKIKKEIEIFLKVEKITFDSTSLPPQLNITNHEINIQWEVKK